MAKRIISMFLVVMMLLTAVLFAACGKKDDGEAGGDTTMDPAVASRLAYESRYLETYNPESTADTYVEDLEKTYDFERHEFKFLNCEPYCYMYTYLDPDMTGDVLDDCCFERNLIAEEKFNITISEDMELFENLATKAKNLIYADEDIYDVMYIPVANLTPLISENLFYDLLEIDELNIDQKWWDQPLITRNIIEDRLFYATSDMHLMAFEGIWCMYFNEDMMNDLGLEMPFQLALDGKWTYDKLMEYCAAAVNLNGDSSYIFDVNGKSRYGLVNFGNAGYLAYAMGAEYASRDENGRYQFTADTDPHFTAVWESIIDFFGPDNGMQLTASNIDLDPDGYFTVFETNRALFLHAELKGAPMLREWEGNFGLMPQPKYDENQESYNSNIFGNCLSFCIPNTNTELERTGIIVDYLTYESYRSLLPRYYDIHVALKSLERQESIEVLKLIRGTRGCEVSVPYGWTGDLNTALRTITLKNEKSIASTIQTYKDKIVANINATYAEYPDLNHVD